MGKFDHGYCFGKIDALHGLVNLADVKFAKSEYGGAYVDTETIRKIFGWRLCDEAKTATEERIVKNGKSESDS